MWPAALHAARVGDVDPLLVLAFPICDLVVPGHRERRRHRPQPVPRPREGSERGLPTG